MVTILETDEAVRTARVKARKEFIAVCEREFGYVPFNDTYLDRCWPVE